MAQDYSTTQLLRSIKTRGMIPSTAEALDTADFLSFADNELQDYVVPLIMSVREEYFVASADQTVVSGTSSYRIPARSIGGKLRDVTFAADGTNFVKIPRTEPERVEMLGTGGSPGAYYLKANSVVLAPTPTTGGTLRISYFRRPSKLVATTACSALNAAYAVGSTALVVTSTIPTTFTSATLVDVVKATPGFDSENDDRVLASPSGTAATIASPGLLSATAAGDFLCLAGESPIPQIPVELHGLLAQRVAYKCLEALGDPGADRAGATAQGMEKKVMMLLTPRVEGAVRVLVNFNGPGWNSRGRGGYRF